MKPPGSLPPVLGGPEPGEFTENPRRCPAIAPTDLLHQLQDWFTRFPQQPGEFLDPQRSQVPQRCGCVGLFEDSVHLRNRQMHPSGQLVEQPLSGKVTAYQLGNLLGFLP